MDHDTISLRELLSNQGPRIEAVLADFDRGDSFLASLRLQISVAEILLVIAQALVSIDDHLAYEGLRVHIAER